MSMAGLSVDANDYVNYYAVRDPFRPLIETAPTGNWVQLSKCLPQTVLRSDEWYNDYAVKAGIGDIIWTGSSIAPPARSSSALIGESIKHR